MDAWETTYLHLLPARPTPTTRCRPGRMEGTALRPVRAALAETGWDSFRAALGVRLAEAYPVRDSEVCFPFRRIFFVARTGARTGARAEENP